MIWQNVTVMRGSSERITEIGLLRSLTVEKIFGIVNGLKVLRWAVKILLIV